MPPSGRPARRTRTPPSAPRSRKEQQRMSASSEVVKASPPQPVGIFDYHRVTGTDGYEYVRVWEGSHLLDLIEIAFRQASYLAGKADKAETEDACRLLVEDALRCMSAGEHYARMLLDTLAGINPRLVREPAI